MRETYPVMNGAEAFFLKGNDVGLLISHGFMGTPQSVQYLGEKFFELGYTVYAPRLKGHGTHYEDLEKTTHQDWFSELEKGYKFLQERCSKIFVVGQSMGGTLALWLANKYSEINGLCLINAALTIPEYEHLTAKTSPRYLAETAPDINLKGVYEITYDTVPIQAIHELQALMKKTPSILANITNPILCFKSAVDHVVPTENTEYILEHIGSVQKEAVTLHRSFHVASMDYDKDEIILKTHRFIQEIIQKTSEKQLTINPNKG